MSYLMSGIGGKEIDRISDILNIKPGMTAVIGSGGKTTCLNLLAEELSEKGRVIMCTSTHINTPKTIRTVTDCSMEVLKSAITQDNPVCIGKPCGNDKLSSSGIPYSLLMQMADYVLVEADGAKHRPLKAHESFEPVIPFDLRKGIGNNLILIIGISGIGRKVNETVHRSAVFARLTGISEEDIVTSYLASEVINHELRRGMLGDVTSIIINQVETEEDISKAHQLAGMFELPVYIGALERGRLRKA